MEAILARHATLTDFLNSPAAIIEYRDALKLYMGEGASFDSVYEEFIRQIKAVNRKIPRFGTQAWQTNPRWRQETFTITGEMSGSGLEVRRENVLLALEKFKEETKAQAGNLVDERSKVAGLVEELKSLYGLLPESETVKMKRADFVAYQRRLGGDLAPNGIKIADHPITKQLSAYMMQQVLQNDERVGDSLSSGIADLVIDELRKLARPARFKDSPALSNSAVPPEVLSYLNFSTPTQLRMVNSFEGGLASMKEFRSVGDPRLSPEILAKLQAVNMIPAHLSTSDREEYEKWQKEAALVSAKKEKIANDYASDSYFYYPLHRDPVRQTVRLKGDSATGLRFVPSPRPFHAFFAGRKTGECVGGRCSEQLLPKRWARAALSGAESLFTETEHGMEGMIGITRLSFTPTSPGKFAFIRRWLGRSRGVKTTYDVVDLMSRGMKAKVVVKSPQGLSVTYSIFDLFVERYQRRPGSLGLVISDGHNVSQNVGGGEVVNYSPAYVHGREVGSPLDFSPWDDLANEISRQFPRTLWGYGRGNMIYDGMKGDGTKVVQLLPSSERPKWTKTQLEDQLMAKLFFTKAVEDGDPIWASALESGVRLESNAFYQRQFNVPDSPLLARAIESYFSANPSNTKYLQAMAQNPETAMFRKSKHFALTRDSSSLHWVREEGYDAMIKILKHHPADKEIRTMFLKILTGAAANIPGKISDYVKATKEYPEALLELLRDHQHGQREGEVINVILKEALPQILLRDDLMERVQRYYNNDGYRGVPEAALIANLDFREKFFHAVSRMLPKLSIQEPPANENSNDPMQGVIQKIDIALAAVSVPRVPEDTFQALAAFLVRNPSLESEFISRFGQPPTGEVLLRYYQAVAGKIVNREAWTQTMAKLFTTANERHRLDSFEQLLREGNAYHTVFKREPILYEAFHRELENLLDGWSFGPEALVPFVKDHPEIFRDHPSLLQHLPPLWTRSALNRTKPAEESATASGEPHIVDDILSFIRWGPLYQNHKRDTRLARFAEKYGQSITREARKGDPKAVYAALIDAVKQMSDCQGRMADLR